MRISDSLTSSVVFLGVADDKPGKEGIHCIGTGFLLSYDQVGYLVTAKHVAKDLHDQPFRIRVNKPDGTSGNLDGDHVKWTFHPDPNVDLAAILFHLAPQHGFEAIYIPHDMMIDRVLKRGDGFGIGDICYSIGLFRVLQGETRNLPVVHTGNLALLPGNETVPVRDWDDPAGKRIRNVEAYLVEMQTLRGLSGSPVFIRPVVDTLAARFVRNVGPTKEMVRARVTMHDVFLLGLWQASWDAPPSEVVAMEHGRGIQVPVGMGVVVPSSKILELLDQPELAKARDDAKKLRESDQVAASPSSISRPSDDKNNPHHKEDFTRLLSVAAKTKRQDD